MLPRLLTLIHRLEDGLLTLLLGSMILLAGGQILLRNLFDSGISWSDPVLRVLVLWVGMFGAIIATQQDRHIRIDLLSRYLSPVLLRYSRRANYLFSGVVCALLAWHSGRFVYLEWLDGNTLVSAVPIWIAESILPFGFGVMTLHFCLLLFTRDEGEHK